MNRLTRLAAITTLAAAAATMVALGTAGQARAAFPGYNGRIAYERGGNIYTISPNGCGERFLTSGYGPAWSADGTKLAFVRDGDVYTIWADGTHETRLTTGGHKSAPAWSPDGSEIALTYHTDATWFLDVPDNDVRVISSSSGLGTKTPAGSGNDEKGPSWSPDGTKVAYALWDTDLITGGYANAIELVNPDGTGASRLGGAWLESADAPDWSPDGTKLVYQGSAGRLYTEKADGSDEHRLPYGQHPAWSPDGTKIAYEYWPDRGIYVMNADGSGSTRLVDGYDPSWQPTKVRMVDCLIPTPLSP